MAKRFGQRSRLPTERLQKISAGSGPYGTGFSENETTDSRPQDFVNDLEEVSRTVDGTADDSAAEAPPARASKRQMLSHGMLLDSGGNALISPILARDACKCSDCIDPSDRQRNFSYADIPLNIGISNVTRVGKKGERNIRWINDAPPHYPGKGTVLDRETIASLRKAFRNPRWDLYGTPRRLWDAETFTDGLNRVDFNEYLNEDDALAETLHLLWRDGLVFVDGVPGSEASVSKIVTRIGPLMNTFYGPTWDVRSVPDAKNVAYTAKYLGFHMDLLYMREPPAFQFLHCIHNESQGGESRFADTLKAVDVLQGEDPSKVVHLMKNQVRYEYDNDGHFYSDAKPTIVKQTGFETPRRHTQNAQFPLVVSDVNQVHWSPPFVGHLQQRNHERLVGFISASKAFSDILERPEMVVEEKMDSGTCVIFDNLRVVHARNAFDKNSGRRWLRGAYLARQDFVSRASGLSNKFPATLRYGSGLRSLKLTTSSQDTPSFDTTLSKVVSDEQGKHPSTNEIRG
ncbi:hypothetical protein H2200_005785 [Cladophialophora chaetospira]|uniref:TauD/TfdA-like domain-containing protein n=1 Tax=Cladophialophora chaetospira TaxID=386627 RepID=A0AA38X9T4_9EURO|nr:hypothetical protein H2200_005785 [Cladophialophora chaetospira]